jgi:hypothetical protein
MAFLFHLMFMHCNNRMVGQSMWDLWWTKCHGDSFFQVLGISPVSIIPLVLHTYSFIYHQCYIILAIGSIVELHT